MGDKPDKYEFGPGDFILIQVDKLIPDDGSGTGTPPKSVKVEKEEKPTPESEAGESRFFIKPTHQHINTSTSTHQHINTSTHQHINTSTHNTSTHQHTGSPRRFLT